LRQVVGIWLEARRIFAGEDSDNAGSTFRRRQIDLRNAAFRNRALDQSGVHQFRGKKFSREFCRAVNFEFAVNAGQRLAKRGWRGECIHYAIAATVVSARTMLRFASSILNSLCL